MNTLKKYSAGLLGIGLILALLPVSSNPSLIIKPQNLLSESLDEKSYMTVDQVAKLIVTEDSLTQLIDLRPPEEYRNFSLPGAINIPYSDFLKSNPVRFLNNGNVKNILYSNGDLNSNYTFVITRGLNFKNTYVMKGGLNEWFKTVMNARFTGQRISARENAVYETRIRAKKLFTDINSLPDDLKLKYVEAKHIAARKLDGGCE